MTPSTYSVVILCESVLFVTQTSKVPLYGRLLLMFDRWRKLSKAFYNEKKNTFDISKVPDIYDSAKYDAIHNAHIAGDLHELYNVSLGSPRGSQACQKS